MPVIQNPNTGDPFLDLMVVSGISDEVLQLMSRDTQKYVRSLSREEIREYQKVYRAVKAIYCR